MTGDRNKEQKLPGKKALVTGSGTGIGREIALEFARQRADVVLHYGHSDKGPISAVDEIKAMGRHLYQVEKFSELDLELHLQIAQASHNKIMVHLVWSIRDAIRQAIVASTTAILQTSRDLARLGQKLHLTVVKALQEQDARAAGEAMAQHWSQMEALLSGGNPGNGRNIANENRVAGALHSK